MEPLQRACAELEQFVREGHPPVGRADLTGARPVPAAGQPGVADGGGGAEGVGFLLFFILAFTCIIPPFVKIVLALHLHKTKEKRLAVR